jgi:S1-C subfamily serine protease
MNRYFSLAASLFLLACGLASAAPPEVVKLRVRIILVDKELNQKPVPFVVVSLKSAAKTAELKTDLDGTAETRLPAGKYVVTTPKPVELGGKRYSWNVKLDLSAGEQHLDLSNDNAKTEELAEPAAAVSDSGSNTGDLTEQFKRLKNTVVTVKSEIGQGTGFFVDNKGLILTNQHVVNNSEYLAVQFDREHKVAARLIASDPQNDVALLWVNMAAFPNAIPAPLPRTTAGHTTVQEGERVFTIGSPLSLEKMITTGIISKVEQHTIMSDININPGNSGGPLFNKAGQVVGLTTFGARDSAGPGVSGIVRIESALTLLDQNRAKASGTAPSGALLPVEPVTPYPVAGLKESLQAQKLDSRPYYFSMGDFDVALSTPPLDYREQEEKRLQAERERGKRNKKYANNHEENSETPKQWEEEAGAHPAVLGIYVQAKAAQGVGAGIGHAFLNPHGAAKLKFKADFQKMKLFCGDKEVQPIQPGRVPVTVSVHNYAWKMDDTTFKGVYVYPPDAVSPECKDVKLVVYSNKSEEPVTKTLDEKTVQLVWADFDAFRRAASTK